VHYFKHAPCPTVPPLVIGVIPRLLLFANLFQGLHVLRDRFLRGRRILSHLKKKRSAGPDNAVSHLFVYYQLLTTVRPPTHRRRSSLVVRRASWLGWAGGFVRAAVVLLTSARKQEQPYVPPGRCLLWLVVWGGTVGALRARAATSSSGLPPDSGSKCPANAYIEVARLRAARESGRETPAA
jgi:hypothetical protein